MDCCCVVFNVLTKVVFKEAIWLLVSAGNWFVVKDWICAVMSSAIATEFNPIIWLDCKVWILAVEIAWMLSEPKLFNWALLSPRAWFVVSIDTW